MKKTNFNNIEDKIGKYSSLTENELMKELLNEANKSKQKGELNSNMLDSFYNGAKTFLNNEQQARLLELINLIKSS